MKYQLWYTMFWRDFRAGTLNTMIIAIVIAVAALSSVGFLSERIFLGLEKEKATVLGADLVLRSHQPISSEWASIAAQKNLYTSETVVLPSMIAAQKAPDIFQLVSLKAVDQHYPLVGCVQISATFPATDSSISCVSAPPPNELWVEPLLLEQLQVQVGDSLTVGEKSFRITAVILQEPDRGNIFSSLAPRILMHKDTLALTDLLGFGSRAQYRWLLSGDNDALLALRKQISPSLVPEFQEFESIEDARPEVQKTLERGTLFLSLVALLSTVIASVALVLSAIAYTQNTSKHIAVIRCLGCTARSALGIVIHTCILAALLAGVFGCVLGWLIHFILVHWLQEVFVIQLPSASVLPALKAIALGVLLIIGFVITLLLRLYYVSPAQVLRRSFTIQKRLQYGVFISMAITFFLLLWVYIKNLLLAFALGGALIVMVCFLIGLMYLALTGLHRLVLRSSYTSLWKLALLGMVRRKWMVAIQTTALSVGVLTLLLLVVAQRDMLFAWKNSVPYDAPNRFIANISPAEKDAIKSELAALQADTELYKMARGRLVEHNRKPIDVSQYTDRSQALLKREFNIGFHSRPPTNNIISSGNWFSNEDLAEVSLEKELMENLGFEIGDTLTWNFGAQPIVTTIIGTREVNWSSLEVNFYAIMPESLANNVSITYVGATRIEAEQQHAFAQILKNHPHILIWNLDGIFEQLQAILTQVGAAVQLLAYFSLAAGGVVLYAALSVHMQSRAYEFSLLRSLGATQKKLQYICRIELLLLGIFAGLFGAAGAQIISYTLMGYLFDITFHISADLWVFSVAIAVTAVFLSAWLPLRKILKSAPIHLLRFHQS